MVIGECLSDEQVKAFTDIYNGSVLPELPGHTGWLASELMTEEAGNMVIALTTWETREDCLRYHSSRSYRSFVAKTQHMLAGNFVVKIFQSERTTAKSLNACDHKGLCLCR
jgi:heme-degrading monooxygenase HmoA